jgi:tetratricopeptide (TPR) repeat protein
MDKGNFQEALTYSKKAIAIEKQLKVSEDLLGEAAFYLLQCEILLKMGSSQKAYDDAYNIYNAINKFYKDESHELQARVLIILSAAALKLGRLELAKENIIKCIKILEEAYGSNANQLDLANALVIMGDVHAFEQNHIQAKKHYIKADKMFKAILVSNKIDDVSYLYSRMAVNAAHLKDHYEMESYFTLHRDNFGHSHIRTNQIRSYFAENDMMVPL